MPIAGKIGCTAQRLRAWVERAEVRTDSARKAALVNRERFKHLERENAELKRANAILRKALAIFCPGGARPSREVMMASPDAHRAGPGVEPI